MVQQVLGEKIVLWFVAVWVAVFGNYLLNWNLGTLNIIAVAAIVPLASAFLFRVAGAAFQRGALAESERYGEQAAERELAALLDDPFATAYDEVQGPRGEI